MARPKEGLPSRRLTLLVRRYQEGVPVARLRTDFGLSTDRLYRLLTEAGVERRGRPAHNAGTVERNQMIVGYAQTHPTLPLADLSRRFRLSRSQLCYILGRFTPATTRQASSRGRGTPKHGA